MELATPSLHKQIIDMCDCYLESDYLERLQGMEGLVSADVEEDSIKYLALTVLYAVTEGVTKLSFKKSGDKVSVTANLEGEKNLLPIPNAQVLDRIFSVMQSVMHHRQGTKSLLMALSVGGNPFEVNGKLKVKDGKKSLKLYFKPTLI